MGDVVFSDRFCFGNYSNNMVEVTNEVKDKVLLDPEGEANLIYGKIGSGKTYLATAQVIKDLQRGRTVYVTWPIEVDNQEDTKDLVYVLRSIFMPWNKRFYFIGCRENLHYINAETGEVDGIPTFNPQKKNDYIEYLNKLNHCVLYIDEAWRVIDSYVPVRDVGEARNLILVTRHKFRTVYLIAQRTMSISIYARANMNRFYKCEKIFKIGSIVLFKKSEYQEMEGENVADTKDPESVRYYLGNSEIFKAYNSWYEGDLFRMHEKVFRVFELGYKERFKAFFAIICGIIPENLRSKL